MVRKKARERRTAALLLTLDQHRDLCRQSAMHGLPGAESFKKRHDLPLVVDRAPRHNALAMGAVDDCRLERRAVPEFQGLRRLDVVVPVIKKVRRGAPSAIVMG